jgi:hypothetical protein
MGMTAPDEQAAVGRAYRHRLICVSKLRGGLAALASLAETAREYMAGAKAEATKRALFGSTGGISAPGAPFGAPPGVWRAGARARTGGARKLTAVPPASAWHRRPADVARLRQRAIGEGGFGGCEGAFGEREAKPAVVDLAGLLRRSSEGPRHREGEAQPPPVGLVGRGGRRRGAAPESNDSATEFSPELKALLDELHEAALGP